MHIQPRYGDAVPSSARARKTAFYPIWPGPVAVALGLLFAVPLRHFSGLVGMNMLSCRTGPSRRTAAGVHPVGKCVRTRTPGNRASPHSTALSAVAGVAGTFFPTDTCTGEALDGMHEAPPLINACHVHGTET